MNYIIKISPTAFSDLQNGIDYYNDQQKGLGKKFHNEVKAMFTQLKKAPASGSFMYGGIRYRVLRKFPYIILYEIVNNNIIAVYRVFHTSLNPSWK